MLDRGLSLILSEFTITERLLRSNFYTFMGYFITGVIARVLVHPLPPARFLHHVCLSIFGSLLYSYVFELANQATSVPEDRVNKPHRPIPAGLLSKRQAYIRWIISWTLSPALMHLFWSNRAAVYFTIWESWVTFVYVWPRYNHWVFRHAFVAGAVVLASRIHNEMASALTPKWDIPTWPDLVFGAWIFCSIHLQEFHDVDGDRVAKRRTLALELTAKGRKRLRLATSVFLVVSSSVISLWTWSLCRLARGYVPMFTGGVHLCLACLMAVQILRSESKEMDRALYFGSYHSAGFTLVIHLAQLYCNIGKPALLSLGIYR
ncbi:hypothetical protein CFD26_104857 [Aspergillus turcosus]|uniref:Uncharacterized protein n=1 Tax=Aspergillus turcosus TaxID=1245748 RepID=A0A421D0J2_9EURO|nr:hypothetical protein CFD26_104857 [Aspergillus turcosus]